MGLFDWIFRRKKRVTPVAEETGPKVMEVRTVQQEAAPKPAHATPPTPRHNMSLNKYEVKAVFVPTNRSRKRVFYGKSEADVRAQLSDYKEPESLIELQYDPPTQAQLDYARNLHIRIPAVCCKEDMSALISEALRREHEELHGKQWRHVPPGNGLKQFAAAMHIPFSLYAEEFIVIRSIYMFVKEKRVLIAFMIACMYRHLKGYWNFSNWEKWLRDADGLLMDDSFVRSYERNTALEDGFCGFDYWDTISKRSKVYQALAQKTEN